MKRFALNIAVPVVLLLQVLNVAGQDIERSTLQYRLSEDFVRRLPDKIDTTFTLTHRHRITDKYSAFNAYPGNYGLPLYQINYFDRSRNPDYYLYQNYIPFMYIPAKALFMDTPVPFTELFFTYGGPAQNVAEQTFRIKHSQNLNRFLNFGLVYDIVYSLGQYSYQKAENKNFILHSSYIREKYRLYGALGINNLYSNHNGGVIDPLTIDQFDTRDVPVRLGGLNRAKSSLRNRNLMLVQHYSPTGFRDEQTGEGEGGLLGQFTHVMITETNKRSYFDASPLSGFYDTVFISSAVTNDSLSAFMISNTIRGDFGFRTRGGFEFIAGGGLRHEYHNYSQVWPPLDTTGGVFADTAVWNRQNLVITGSIENRIGQKFGWRAFGDLYFGGYRAGDFDITGEIYKDFEMKKGRSDLVIKGRISNLYPSTWLQQWGGNNFNWQTGFQGREFTTMAGADFSYPGRLFEAGFRYSITDNFTYFGTSALPEYYSGAISVAAFTIDKTIKAGGFRFGNRILLQQSSNSTVLDLPLVTLRSALWFDKNIYFRITGGNLHIETGGEVFLHTPYHAMSYMPATGRFHNQNSIETGNYPFVNVFLNVKIKRTRIMLCFDHVNSGLTGIEYTLLPLYPLNMRMLRYGIAWTFYD